MTELDPIRGQREELAKDPAHVVRILKEGTDAARAVVSQTLSEVHKAMHIDYL